MVILKAEQKQEFRKKLIEKAKEARWLIKKDPPFKHHVLMEVIKE
jgi:hypothetical protein